MERAIAVALDQTAGMASLRRSREQLVDLPAARGALQAVAEERPAPRPPEMRVFSKNPLYHACFRSLGTGSFP